MKIPQYCVHWFVSKPQTILNNTMVLNDRGLNLILLNDILVVNVFLLHIFKKVWIKKCRSLFLQKFVICLVMFAESQTCEASKEWGVKHDAICTKSLGWRVKVSFPTVGTKQWYITIKLKLTVTSSKDTCPKVCDVQNNSLLKGMNLVVVSYKTELLHKICVTFFKVESRFTVC